MPVASSLATTSLVRAPLGASGALPTYVAARPPAAVYARRRLVALVVVLAIVLGGALVAGWGAGRLTAAPGGRPASAPGRAPALLDLGAPDAAGPAARAGVATRTVTGGHVVRPGDTLWSVARALQPDGDVRALVRALREANGGSDLRVGQLLVLP